MLFGKPATADKSEIGSRGARDHPIVFAITPNTANPRTIHTPLMKVPFHSGSARPKHSGVAAGGLCETAQTDSVVSGTKVRIKVHHDFRNRDHIGSVGTIVDPAGSECSSS